MSVEAPKLIVLPGPNGAGKSTAAPVLLRGRLGVREFVNADTIAAGLSAFAPERSAVAAGRIMLRRIEELAAARVDFGFETTLASRSFAPWIRGLLVGGYEFHLVFLWLPSPEAAIARVAERVRSGGHDVPSEVIRRRFTRGAQAFHGLYRPLATPWRVYDNSDTAGPRMVASGEGELMTLLKPQEWAMFSGSVR